MVRTVLFVVVWLTALCGRAQQLVLPGDHPDPSVVKIGDTFWASATTSNWMPAYPLYKSKDLVNWQAVSAVFPTLPGWADYYFWAPEISYDNGKVWVYYSAHKKGGNLCLGVASADKPEGPYLDHGTLMCQPAGSIDAFPMRDENGKLHLIWKEDGNSVNKPTPIWIQEMNEGRTALLGEKKELFRNDAPWEGALVEGVSMVRHDGHYYAFYAAAGCCGEGCTYTTGVARAKSLVGPWEKYAKNPVLTNEEEWNCPGHGTPVEHNGRHYLLYHAYNKNGGVYTGRQGLLKEFRFTADGWIEFVSDRATDVATPRKTEDEFNKKLLGNEWQWSVFVQPKWHLKGGRLTLLASSQNSAAVLGRKNYAPDYTAMVEINRRRSTAPAGMGLIGDDKNRIVALIGKENVEIVQVKDGKESVLFSQAIPPFKLGHLAMQVRNGKDIQFLYGQREGDLKPLNSQPIDGKFLPPWDRAVRIGLVVQGREGEQGVFEEFEVVY